MHSRRVAVSTMLSPLSSPCKFNVCVWVCVFHCTLMCVVTVDRENDKQWCSLHCTCQQFIHMSFCLRIDAFNPKNDTVTKNARSLSQKSWAKFWDHFHEQCGHFRCIFKSSGSLSATCSSLNMEKHIVSINRKKGSELISLNSLLPCLHMSLEDSVLIWLLKQARTLLKSLCVCVCVCMCFCLYAPDWLRWD